MNLDYTSILIFGMFISVILAVLTHFQSRSRLDEFTAAVDSVCENADQISKAIEIRKRTKLGPEGLAKEYVVFTQQITNNTIGACIPPHIYRGSNLVIGKAMYEQDLTEGETAGYGLEQFLKPKQKESPLLLGLMTQSTG